MANKRQILATLSRPSLQGLATKHEVVVQDRRSKDGLNEALAAARRVSASDILNALPIATLQQVCKSLGLAPGPRQKAKLVEHVLGGRAVKAGTTSGATKKAAKKAVAKTPARKKIRSARTTKTTSTRSDKKPGRKKATATPVSKAKARKAGGATKKAPTRAATSTRQGAAKKAGARKKRGASTGTSEQTTQAVIPTDPLPPPESPPQQERVATGEASEVVSGVTAAAASVQDIPLAPVEPTEMPMQTSPVKDEMSGDAYGQTGEHQTELLPEEAGAEPNAVQPASTAQGAIPAVAALEPSSPDFQSAQQERVAADDAAAVVDEGTTAVATTQDAPRASVELAEAPIRSPAKDELSVDACSPTGERGEAESPRETGPMPEAPGEEPEAVQPTEAPVVEDELGAQGMDGSGEDTAQRAQQAQTIPEATDGEATDGEPKAVQAAEAPQDMRHEGMAEVVTESGAPQDPEVERGVQWPSAEVISLEGHTACSDAQADKKPAPESEGAAEQPSEQYGVEGSEPDVATKTAGDSFMVQAINAVLRRNA